MRISRAILLAGLGASSLALGSEREHGRVVRVEKEPPREVYVPGGQFQMGITDTQLDELVSECQDQFPNDNPVLGTGNQSVICLAFTAELPHMKARKVYVSPFWIDRLEVSIGDYRACVKGGGCASDAMVAGDDRYVDGDDANPMVNVQWEEAQRYCHWRGGRLPTEAEWERAARGDGNGPWPWGSVPRPNDFNHGKQRSRVESELDARATPNGFTDSMQGEPDDSDGAKILSHVGSYAWGEGPYGTLDMAGNVSEWTADAYLRPTMTNGSRTGASLEFDKAGYDDLDVVNPERAGTLLDSRVVRGGSWRQPMMVSKVYVRDPLQSLEGLGGSSVYDPHRRLPYVGFRCARSDADRN